MTSLDTKGLYKGTRDPFKLLSGMPVARDDSKTSLSETFF